MKYECAFCHKIVNEEDGVMILKHMENIIGNPHMYVFKCKHCMSEKGKELFSKESRTEKK